MGAQFGQCNFDERPVDPAELDRVRTVLSAYGPDAEGVFRKDNIGILYRAFHTTNEVKLDKQPYLSNSGAVITWDGRLDNRSELIDILGHGLSGGSTDLTIVAAAFEHWGTDCFGKLIGDWSISVWDSNDQTLVLAKDSIGTCHLYYLMSKSRVAWSTILDPLVLFAGRTFSLNEEYIAGWLSFFPSAHLTPYVGIESVPPASFVLLSSQKRTVKRYWEFPANRRIRYRDDREYEDHFREAFGKAVGRRLRSDHPILAELSGGMDSSSVVCMADAIIARGSATVPRLDTISYYNDSEPNWNERPYFTKVEEKRGRTGRHVDVGNAEFVELEPEVNSFAALPASAGGQAAVVAQRFADHMRSHGHRVVLSGTGGDEVTGGVPTAIPELMDLLASLRFKTLAHELKVWALNQRKPWFHLLLETAQTFLPLWLVGVPKHMRPAPWLNPAFVERNRPALIGYPERVKFSGSLPSFQENLSALEMLRRQLACSAIPSKPPREKRYPYLDRDFLEFMYAIPREQVVRPGQRRSLMRRALKGIVPDEVLERKRKAFVVRSPILASSAQWERLLGHQTDMVMMSVGIVEPDAFLRVLKTARYDEEIPTLQLMRTLSVEIWLRILGKQGVLAGIS
jgi:asparagine synthase (glutamine-hydrolysing)